MKISSRIGILISLIMGLAIASGAAAQAVYYHHYKTIALTPDADECDSDGDGNCTGAQGFMAGSTYLYSIKTRTGENHDRSVIYRINKATKATVVMTNANNGKKYNTYLGHANDMAIVGIDGTNYFFVVTMKAGGPQLVKLKYSGSTYEKVGTFDLQNEAGTVKAASGISRVSVTDSEIDFLFKTGHPTWDSGARVFNASIPLNANGGTVVLTRAFDLKVKGASIDGVPVLDIEEYLDQGFFYDAAKNDIYYPLTKGSSSIVLVYRDVTPLTTGTQTSDPDVSIHKDAKKYPKFEIEGVAISGGKLYFNTNRSNSSGAFDGVHELEEYDAS